LIRSVDKRYRKPKGQSKMDNPEKMVTFGTQDKQSKKQRKYAYNKRNGIEKNTHTTDNKAINHTFICI
jgi:hypothetical protein